MGLAFATLAYPQPVRLRMSRYQDSCPPAREQLRGLLADVVDELSDAAAGRVLGVLFGAARRELERAHRHDGQLVLTAGQ
jgi:hypothetical protein